MKYNRKYPELTLQERCHHMLQDLTHYSNGRMWEQEDIQSLEAFVLAEIERAALLLGAKP